jgi:hypothetical protein
MIEGYVRASRKGTIENLKPSFQQPRISTPASRPRENPLFTHRTPSATTRGVPSPSGGLQGAAEALPSAVQAWTLEAILAALGEPPSAGAARRAPSLPPHAAGAPPLALPLAPPDGRGGLLGELQPDAVLCGTRSLLRQPVGKLADRVAAESFGNPIRVAGRNAVVSRHVTSSLPRVPESLEAVYGH